MGNPLHNLKRECDHAEKPGGWCGRCEGRAPKKAGLNYVTAPVFGEYVAFIDNEHVESRNIEADSASLFAEIAKDRFGKPVEQLTYQEVDEVRRALADPPAQQVHEISAGIADQLTPSEAVPCVEHNTHCFMHGETHVPSRLAEENRAELPALTLAANEMRELNRRQALEGVETLRADLEDLAEIRKLNYAHSAENKVPNLRKFALDADNAAEVEAWAEDWLRAKIMEGAVPNDREAATEDLREKMAELVPFPGGEDAVVELLDYNGQNDDSASSFFDSMQASLERVLDKVFGSAQTAHAGLRTAEWMRAHAGDDFGDMMGRSGPIEGGDNDPAAKPRKRKKEPMGSQHPPACSGDEQRAMCKALIPLLSEDEVGQVYDMYIKHLQSTGNELAPIAKSLIEAHGLARLIPQGADERWFEYTGIGIVRDYEAKNPPAKPTTVSDMGIEDVPTIDPRDRQRRLDTLLDQYSAEQDPERRTQLEEQMRSLRAQIGGWLKSARQVWVVKAIEPGHERVLSVLDSELEAMDELARLQEGSNPEPMEIGQEDSSKLDLSLHDDPASQDPKGYRAEMERTAPDALKRITQPFTHEERMGPEMLAQAKDAILEILGEGDPMDLDQLAWTLADSGGKDTEEVLDQARKAINSLESEGKVVKDQNGVFSISEGGPRINPETLRRHQDLERSDGVFRNLSPEDAAKPPKVRIPEGYDPLVDSQVISPRDRQRKLDQLLDQYNGIGGHGPEHAQKRKQLQEQMRSLRASLRLHRLMTEPSVLEKAANALPSEFKEGDRVRYDKDDDLDLPMGSEGTVTGPGRNGLAVTWDTGAVATYSYSPEHPLPIARAGDRTAEGAKELCEVCDAPATRKSSTGFRCKDHPEQDAPTDETFVAVDEEYPDNDMLFEAARLAGFEAEHGGGGNINLFLDIADGRMLVFGFANGPLGWMLMQEDGDPTEEGGEMPMGKSSPKEMAAFIKQVAEKHRAYQATFTGDQKGEGLGGTEASSRVACVACDADIEGEAHYFVDGLPACSQACAASGEKRQPKTAAALPPFPKPGERTGRWGWVEPTDIDELWFLTNNDSDLYHAAMRDLNPSKDDTLYDTLGPEMPEVVEWLRENYEAINAKYPPSPVEQSGESNMEVSDVNVEDPDALLDAFNAGDIDQATFERKMRNLHGSARGFSKEATDLQDALMRALLRLKTERPDIAAVIEQELNKELGFAQPIVPDEAPTQEPVVAWLKSSAITCGNCGGSGKVDDSAHPGLGREMDCESCMRTEAIGSEGDPTPGQTSPDAVYDAWIASPEGDLHWKTAYEAFPLHNTDQAADAADFLSDKLEEWVAETNIVTTEEFEAMRESLYESIYAGLT